MSTSTQVVLPAGLVLFLRADSGVVLDANNNVVQWLDQTTNRNDASQFFGVPSVGLTGAAARPGTNIINNGQPALDFGNLGTGANLPHFLQAPSSPSLESVIPTQRCMPWPNFIQPPATSCSVKPGAICQRLSIGFRAGRENVQYGNGFNNAPAGGIGGTILINTPYVMTSMLSFPPQNGLATNNFNFWLNGANNGNGSIRPVTGNPPRYL